MPSANSAPRVRHKLPAVAERLVVPLRTVRTWIANGELRAIDVSATPGSKRPRFVVDEADLVAFEERRATAPPPRQRRISAGAGVPNYIH